MYLLLFYVLIVLSTTVNMFLTELVVKMTNVINRNEYDPFLGINMNLAL